MDMNVLTKNKRTTKLNERAKTCYGCMCVMILL